MDFKLLESGDLPSLLLAGFRAQSSAAVPWCPLWFFRIQKSCRLAGETLLVGAHLDLVRIGTVNNLTHEEVMERIFAGLTGQVSCSYVVPLMLSVKEALCHASL